jgi:hypothetical protein
MINALRKYSAFAPDLRVRGTGMCSFAWIDSAGTRNREQKSPVQSGGNSTL